MNYAEQDDLQIPSLPSATAIAFCHCQIAKASAPIPYCIFVCHDGIPSLFLAPCNVRLPPAGWSSTISVLHQQVCGSNLAFVGAICTIGGCSVRRRSDAGRTMVLAHVELELFRISTRGRFPSRFLGLRMEIIGEVLGVGVTDLPSRGKACVSLGIESVDRVQVCHCNLADHFK